MIKQMGKEKRVVLFEEVRKGIDAIDFGHFDLVVGIARGGIVPAAMIMHKIGCDLELLWLNLRDEENNEKFSEPKLLKPFSKIKGKKVLIVDDVSRTGKTLEVARKLLQGNEVKVFLLKDYEKKADYSLFDFRECVEWPWK